MATPGFRSRVNTSVTFIEQRRGGSIGEAIGQGAEALGRAGARASAQNAQVDEQIEDSEYRLAVQERQRQIATHSADRLGAWAQLQADIGTQLQDERTNSAAGAAGHTGKAQALVRKQMDGFLDTLADEPEVRQRFEPMLQEYEARAIANEGEYETVARAKHQGNSWQQYLDISVNQLVTDPSPGKLEQYILDSDSALELMDVDGTTKEALRVRRDAALYGGFVDGKFQAGQFQDVKALADSGMLAASGLDVGNVLKRVGVEERAQAVATEQAANDARKEAKDALEALEADYEAGGTPSTAIVVAALKRGQDTGVDAADLTRYQTAYEDATILRAYNGANDPMGVKSSAAVAQIDARFATGKATREDVRLRDRLAGYADTRAKQVGAKLKETAKQGVAGQAQVLAQLQALSPEQRYVAAEEAKQGLGQLSLLPARTQSYALEGREVRAARKDEFGKADTVKSAFRSRVGSVAASLGGEYDNMMNIAWDIYAGELNGRGASGWNPAQFDVAVKIAFGATKRNDGALVGGVGQVRGNQVILPDWKTPEEFDKTLSSFTFADAVYANGDAANKADILTHYRPEYVRDDTKGQPVYRFIDGNGKPLRAKNRSVYDVTVVR